MDLEQSILLFISPWISFMIQIKKVKFEIVQLILWDKDLLQYTHILVSGVDFKSMANDWMVEMFQSKI